MRSETRNVQDLKNNNDAYSSNHYFIAAFPNSALLSFGEPKQRNLTSSFQNYIKQYWEDGMQQTLRDSDMRVINWRIADRTGDRK